MKKKARRNISQDFNKKKKTNVFRYKKEVETVLKLNLTPYNESLSFNTFNNPSLKKNETINNNRGISNNMSSNLFDSLNNNINDQESKFEKEINKFAYSLKQLKTFYPNNAEIIELEKTSGVKLPTRVEHMKTENKLKEQISSYEKEENELKNKKEHLENQLLDINKKIDDQLINIEVVVGIEKNNNNKAIREKLVAKFEEEYNKKENENNINNINNIIKRNKKRHFTNNKEFQEELDLFLKREEYNIKQKENAIKDDINNSKNVKKEINENLNIIIEKLKTIHKNKNFVTQKLYNHYLNVLREGKDTRSEGLSWIIREIFNLDKKVMLSYMPEFLDKTCIKYLFNITHLNIEISQVENEIKECKEEFKNLGVINKGDNFLIKNSLIKNKNKGNPKENFDGKNLIMYEYLKKLRQTFCNFPINKENVKINNSKSYVIKRNNNNNNNDNNKINNLKKKSSFKKKSLFSLPFINGDPNWSTKANKEVDYTNQLLIDDINEYIPSILRVKDLEKMTKTTGYFMNSDEIKKVHNFLNLNKKLNNLRKIKENLKLNEMNRIFKEFQRNDYSEKFNTDKKSVISALLGEDNVKSELIKQTKREKKYIEEILKGRMHKKIMSSDKSTLVKNIKIRNKLDDINTKNKSPETVENKKNNEFIEKRYYSSEK